MYQNVRNILISKSEIAKRVEKLGKQITVDYAGKELVLVCILRGSAIFFADLAREITMPVTLDFISISSYENSTSTSGEVKLIKDLCCPIDGKEVLIVEDIIDSGNTIKYLKELLQARKPSGVKVCALLDKPDRRIADVNADYVGFTVCNEFIIGYGLDYNQKYRNLPDICVLDPKVYS